MSGHREEMMSEKSSAEDHSHTDHMRLALDLARKAPPKPTNFCVGAVLVDTLRREVIGTGFTNQLPGNTHAEQCAIMKLQSDPQTHRLDSLSLYTTMEPCNKRASGNIPCTDTILQAKQSQPSISIQTVYIGVTEPETFVGQNLGRKKLEDAGIKYVHVPGLEAEILEVATAGHVKE